MAQCLLRLSFSSRQAGGGWLECQGKPKQAIVMDINFKCQHCDQELSADASGAGTQIECPSCGQTLVIPAPPAAPPAPAGQKVMNPITLSAAAREERHYSVPQHDKEAAAPPAIEKPLKPLEVTAKETDKKIRVKSIRRSDCVEVGKDHFDERVTEFLGKVGEENIVSVNTFNYTHQDLATRQWIEDFGVLVVYRG